MKSLRLLLINPLKIEKLVKLTGASNKGFEELTAFFKTLDELTDRNFNISLDFSLARGLSYYTGMIYEVKPTEVTLEVFVGVGAMIT